MRRIIISLIIIVTVIPFSRPSHAWLIFHKPQFSGKVIDAETKEPIEGAVVVVIYRKRDAGLGPDSSSSPFDAKETLTDKNGIFEIPSFTTIMSPFSSTSFAEFIIFKPNYGSFPGCHKEPKGITAVSEELFFSQDFGKERKIESWVGEGRDAELLNINATFGLVELPKLKTFGDRYKAIGMFSMPIEIPSQKIKILLKFYNEERKFLQLDPVS